MASETIYAISTGSYSDYTVHALFSTKEKAQEYIDTIKAGYDGWNSIEEYVLDPQHAVMVKKGYAPWDVFMYRNGDVEQVKRHDIERMWMEPTVSYIEESRIPSRRGKPHALRVRTLAKSEQHAVKIANEIRTRMIANNEWPNEQ